MGSSPSHLPSWCPSQEAAVKLPNAKHCLGIHVTLTEELGAVPPLSHAWTVPLVEDMLCYARTGLTESVVTCPGRAVLFMEDIHWGLSLGKAMDATFVLTGGGTWVGKPVYLAADPLTVQEGRQVIAQAITKCWIKVRGPGHLYVNSLTPRPFRFDCPRDSP